mmetsp:Transcript_57911/g.123117  ORF Transcript_57911/g.123117 Transcript_57911/m.123117 type:complete len:187 (+) Transcript_57911:90-650(+)
MLRWPPLDGSDAASVMSAVVTELGGLSQEEEESIPQKRQAEEAAASSWHFHAAKKRRFGLAQEEYRFDSDTQASRLAQASYLLHVANRPTEARVLFEETLARLVGNDLQAQAEALADLGGACAATGDLKAALKNSEAACRLYSQQLPQDNPTMQSLVGRLYSLNWAIAAQAAAPAPPPHAATATTT